MSSADVILVINMCVAALLAAAFMTIAVHGVGRAAARWLAFGYVLGIVYCVIEFSIPAFANARPPVVAAFAVFLAATIAFNGGLARKYGVTPPWVPMLFFLVFATVAVYFVQDLPRQSLVRMMAYQLPYAAMQFTGLAIVWSSRQRRGWLDTILMNVLAASAVQFASKPFIAGALGGWGANPQSYLQSSYALVSQSLGTVFALALALLILAVLVRDVLAEATSKSETDMLSQLLNRGGFERHAKLALRDATRRGVPVALVIADLDYFKGINDSFGHAFGDRVIETFAGFLRDAAADHHVAGRIGGEFAHYPAGHQPCRRQAVCRGNAQRLRRFADRGPASRPPLQRQLRRRRTSCGGIFLRPAAARRRCALSGQRQRPQLRPRLDRASHRTTAGHKGRPYRLV
jgi:GGDEF domain-containing protein